MTILVIVAPEVQLRKLAKDIDKVLGYPCEGVPIGGGRHCPGPTRTYADPEQAPDGQWEYPLGKLPAKAQAAVAKHALPVRERMKRPVPAIIEEQIQ